ncbi:MAG TPA: response regulator transcription factor [Bacteroidia bacterium]|jgi:two-component system OmpR family response regulator|nr:response regulator transcription factor [Bacteroidia bacterium]
MTTEKVKILLAEDDANLGILLQEYLEAKGYAVKLAKNGKEGYDLFCKQEYDLCLLDVMMPLKDGFTLAKEIRQSNKQVPIIFLTAKSMKEDTIDGFNAGGDDYITKPFSMEELMLRIQAILRRSMKTQAVENDKVEFSLGRYRFNTEKQMLVCDENEIKLTTKEVQLLRLLVLNKNEVVDRAFTLKTIWHDDNYFNSRSMDVYITKLRKYLKHDQKVEIVNVHGKGFKLLVNP